MTTTTVPLFCPVDATPRGSAYCGLHLTKTRPWPAPNDGRLDPFLRIGAMAARSNAYGLSA